jgi:hypothetical protein
MDEGPLNQLGEKWIKGRGDKIPSGNLGLYSISGKFSEMALANEKIKRRVNQHNGVF